MIKQPRQNLATQLLIGFGLSLLAIGIATLGINYNSLRHNLQQQVQQRAIAITQGLEFATEGVIELQEAALLKRIVQNYATLPTVMEVAIVDPDGIVLAHSDGFLNQTQYREMRPPIATAAQKAAQKGIDIHIRTILKNKPVIAEILPFSGSLFGRAGKRGVAIAVMDLEQLEQEAWRIFLSSTLTMALGMVVILLFLGWLIRRLILQPLAQINRAVQQSEHQGLLILPTLPPNEVGFLGATLASVFNQLKEYQQIELDIAEQKRAEMAELYALATQATRLKDEFLANMSHELRTPLNAILGMSESLQDEIYGVLNDQQQNSIALIESSGSHLLELINDILDLSKIEAGKLDLLLSPVSIAELCDASLTFVTQQATQKNIQLIANCQPNLGNITIDERRMRQVLLNLLNNAVKFTPPGGRVTLDVLMKQSDVGQHLFLVISDTGIGIANNDLPKLFQPFSQIDSSLSRQYEGTGLGLALVKQIVERHGGSVTVQSSVGNGSCFTVKLPTNLKSA